MNIASYGSCAGSISSLVAPGSNGMGGVRLVALTLI